LEPARACGTFYVLNCAVDSGGNYLATATNPTGA